MCVTVWSCKCDASHDSETKMIVNRFAEEFDELDEFSRLGVRSAGGSRRSRNSDSPRDFLANRVSFYMDDMVDGIEGSTPELRVHRKLEPVRSKSFRMTEHKPVRLTRHTSDLSHVSRPPRLQRKRSADSRRSTDSGSSRLKRQESNNSRKKSSDDPGLKLPFKELPPKERRRRVVVVLVASTFVFLVACSVLAVVITLTHSSFHGNNYLPDSYPRNNYSEYGKYITLKLIILNMNV